MRAGEQSDMLEIRSGFALTGIGDEVRRESVVPQQRGQRVDVALLVAVRVGLRVRRARADRPRIVIRDVGGQTTHCRGGSCVLV